MIKSLDILSFISCNSTITLSKQRQEHDHLAKDNKIEETLIPRGTDVNEVFVRSTPRPMSTEHRSRSKELLPPFESRHYSHK
jgi:hypothetical protein